MFRQRREIESQLHQLCDLLLMVLCFYLAHTIRRHLGAELQLRRVVMFREYAWLALGVATIGHFALRAHEFYRRTFAVTSQRILGDAARSMAITIVVALASFYVLDVQSVNRATVFLFGVLSTAAIWLFDLAWHSLALMSAARHRDRRLSVLVGSAAENQQIISLIRNHPEWGIDAMAQINLNVQSVQDLTSLLAEQPVDLVIFTAGKSYLQEVEAAILACEVEGVTAWLMADFIRTTISRASLDELMGKPMIVFRSAPDFSWSLAFKNTFDRIAAAGLLILLLPLWLAIACVVKFSSRGPVLFRQQRGGMRGRVFTMYKFRSMISNAEQMHAELSAFNEMDGPVFKIAQDPRVTPVGRFLRRTSLDELPQIINVLRGEMSMVGPRPLPTYEIKQFKDPWQRRRLSMKPGMTCLWQIAGRNKVSFEEWMRLDLQYIDTWSLWLDFKILLKTIPIVLTGRGAH